ncbi:MAG: hypothetical protein ABWZ98_02760, partial [Nakamurella sp.]
VQTEPPVSQPGPSVTTVPAGLPAPALGSATAVAGGASFNTAPGLTSGSFSDTLSTGETRYYRIHLDWGQRLSYQVLVDRIGGLDHGSGYARSALATPLRQELPLASTSNSARTFGGPESISLTGSTLVPVQYANRDSDRSDVRPYSLAGDYYLSVGMSYPVDAVPYRTGISIAVQVEGTAQPGPQYQLEEKTTPAQESAPSPSSVAALSSAAATQSEPVADPLADQADPTGSTGAPWWVWLVSCIAVMGAAVGVVAIGRRSKRS